MSKQAGEVTITDPGSDKKLLICGTLQCVHCGAHWIPSPGSGLVRGYCGKCHGPICGANCVECVPKEQQLENMEAGRPANHKRNFVGQAGIGEVKTLVVDKNGNPF